MSGFPRRAATGNTMCRSSAGWRPSKSSEVRTFIGLATSDSPTFAGLTATGAAAGDYVAGSFRNTNAGASAYTHLQFGNDGDQNQGYIYLCSSTNPGLAGAGSLNIGSNAALGLIAGGTVKATIAATGIATFYGSAPGTAGAGEVRIGGGQINTAGKVATAQYFESNANSSGSPTAFNATNAEAGNYLTAVVNGSVASGIASWVKASLIESVGANAGEGSLVLGSYRGEITFQVGARTINALSIAATGAAKFNGEIEAAVGGSCLSLTPGSVDHCYLGFYPRTSNPSTRGGYFGFAGAGHTTLTMVAELGFMSFQSSTAPGTAGTNEVRVGAGQINAASDIETATQYKIGGQVQPRSLVALVNIGATTYADIYTLSANDMVQVTVGNATDGYAASAIICKPASGVGAVIVRNDSTSANLTISLSGDAIRVTNGVASTRTTIYCVTRLYG